MARFLWQLLELGLDVLLIALRKPYVCLVVSTSTFEGDNKLFVPRQCTVPFQQFWDSTFKRFHETHDLARWHYLRSTYLPWHMNPSTLCWPGDRGFHRLQCFLDLIIWDFVLSFYHSAVPFRNLYAICFFNDTFIWCISCFLLQWIFNENLRPLVTLRCIWPLSCTIHRHL